MTAKSLLDLTHEWFDAFECLRLKMIKIFFFFRNFIDRKNLTKIFVLVDVAD